VYVPEELNVCDPAGKIGSVIKAKAVRGIVLPVLYFFCFAYEITF
jgi:hypothetical protein